MYWFRVDNRLVHGQVIEAWLPHTGARYLIVASDSLAEDMLRQQIVSLAVPERITVRFSTITALPQTLCACDDDTLVLFEHCQDVARARDAGVPFATLNIGNLHFGPGKRQILPHVALSIDDENIFRRLTHEGVILDFRSVPSETMRGVDESFF